MPCTFSSFSLSIKRDHREPAWNDQSAVTEAAGAMQNGAAARHAGSFADLPANALRLSLNNSLAHHSPMTTLKGVSERR